LSFYKLTLLIWQTWIKHAVFNNLVVIKGLILALLEINFYSKFVYNVDNEQGIIMQILNANGFVEAKYCRE